MAIASKQRLVALTVDGKPIAKGRPRFGKGGHTYTPEITGNAEEIMQGEMRQACATPLEGPLQLSVVFCFRRPKSWPKAQRDAVDNGHEPMHVGKPDLDNLVKLVQDAGNGILWRDDAQIVRLEAIKVYGAENETVINVFPAE
mgnify:CR=1 FL=1